MFLNITENYPKNLFNVSNERNWVNKNAWWQNSDTYIFDINKTLVHIIIYKKNKGGVLTTKLSMIFVINNIQTYSYNI